MNSVLVTGHMGFIGQHLMASEPFFRGYDIRGSNEHFYPHDVVYHLAACGDISASTWHHVEDTFESTVVATQLAKRKLVFTSSGAVYGRQGQPISVYGACKLGAEGLVTAWAEKEPGREWSILRLGNVVGPGCRGVIPDTLRKLKKGGKLVVLGDGSAKKPFVHVADVVKTILRAPAGIHDVRSWSSTSVRDVIRLCCEEVGVSPVIEWGEKPEGWTGDITYPAAMSKSDLHWVTMSSEEAVRRAIRERWAEISQEP